MEFKTNHCDLYPPSAPAIKPGHRIKVPEDRDFFFRAKQYELVDQYTAARFFLRQTDGENYKDWLFPTGNTNADCGIQNTWKSYFYEAALMYYNILVDLSWVLLYLSAEYVCYQDDCAVKFESVKSIGEAMELMRSAEGLVAEPLCATNPIGYIKKICSCQKSLCSDGQNRCAYKARRFGSRYQQGATAKAHPPKQRSWYSVQRIAASFAGS